MNKELGTRSGGHLSRQTRAVRRPHLISKDVRTASPSPRRATGRRGSVTFDHQTSIYPENGEGKEQQGLLKGSKEEEEVEQGPSCGSSCGCHLLVENKAARRLFRVCAVLNLISLVFSAPLRRCSTREDDRDCFYGVFSQLVIITALDFVLTLLYTLQTYVRFQYSLCRWQRKKQVATLISYLSVICSNGNKFSHLFWPINQN